ncbi:MAG: hypothetical protein IPI65_13115 [Bacteroidetes bacterium]|nr:hypothetical protein [Bacteroidota bacterium]
MKYMLLAIMLYSTLYGQSDSILYGLAGTTSYSCDCAGIQNATGFIITSNYISSEGINYFKLKFNNAELLTTDNIIGEDMFFDLYRISHDTIFFRQGGIDTVKDSLKSKETLMGLFAPIDSTIFPIQTASYLGNEVIKILQSENKYYFPVEYPYQYTFYLKRVPVSNYPLIDRLTMLPNGLIVGYRFYTGTYKFECLKSL